MRGRLPAGVEAVWRLNGSDEARRRLQVILEVVAGQCRVQQACERLEVGPTQFERLRTRVLEAALEALEPRPAGRPSQPVQPLSGRVAELEEEVRQLERELVLSRAREELAPLQSSAAAGPSKKNQTRKRSR